MYKDIINYQLAEGITEEHLLKVAGEIIKTWMTNLPGFIKWEIHQNNDGGYSDIVTWENKEAAKNAEAEMCKIPNAMDWYSCYAKDSTSSKNLTLVGAFN